MGHSAGITSGPTKRLSTHAMYDYESLKGVAMKLRYMTIGFFPGVVVGVLLLMLYLKMMQPVYWFVLGEMRLGDVDQPLEHTLGGIVHNYDQGNKELAEQQVRLLERRWSEYVHTKSPEPHKFFEEISAQN